MTRRVVAVSVALCTGLAMSPSGAWAADGAASYRAKCSACHQASGGGVPGQFPKLSGRVARISKTPEGRKYLGAAILFGVNGKIMVEGKPNMGVMPPFGQMTDAEVAAVLNFLSRQGPGADKKGAGYTAVEIAALRKKPTPTAADVRALRAAAEAKGPM